ncbi:MAG TPA: hypothetical protein H9829_11110 [Candidatus Tetragenococcus pullicola]|nr:hypothetical protein [Candidatus Tetragenococcus pullicola]
MLVEAKAIYTSQTGKDTHDEEWGYESVLMEKEELDSTIVPSEVIYELPDDVVAHVYQHSLDETFVYFLTKAKSNQALVKGFVCSRQLKWFDYKKEGNDDNDQKSNCYDQD